MQFGKQNLTTNELIVLSSEMRKREKSLVFAYLMLLMGHLGIHRLYLKRTVSGIIQLALFLVMFISYILFIVLVGIDDTLADSSLYIPGFIAAGIALVGFIALTIWVIVDACLLPGIVRSWNSNLEQTLIAQIVALRPVGDPMNHPGTGQYN
ncbi:NINE protein [Paenibacillus lutimineralis]|uniref:TM2 domain-containing protein n=1 Tax=Paenibacillus lutimineralis TaxID=2707005 RepID=A0A3S9V527_9BACL|nr:TM2 domain-containing protein [Paenibacillus lutimineralis]AZS17667.1 TM2 domain-containing protein [Paenibacillus lutimineralis]